MKRCVVFLTFFLVMFSLASSIAAGVWVYAKIEMKEKDGKEIDHESGFDKDKIFENSPLAVDFFGPRIESVLQSDSELSSLPLGTDINPPDNF